MNDVRQVVVTQGFLELFFAGWVYAFTDEDGRVFAAKVNYAGVRTDTPDNVS